MNIANCCDDSNKNNGWSEGKNDITDHQNKHKTNI